MDTPTCNCPDPALCRLLKRHIAGRLWEIWTGVNIDPGKAEKYRSLWRRQAALSKEALPDPAPAPSSSGGAASAVSFRQPRRRCCGKR